MTLSDKAQQIYTQITAQGSRLGDLRTIAKEIKKDHNLASELWQTGELFPMLLAILIMDKKELSPGAVDRLFSDMAAHNLDDRTQLTDWLMANQLTKDKKTIALIESWQTDEVALKRRIFWYYQGRLRWVGQVPPDNSGQLLRAIAQNMPTEVPEVQWAMNFTAGWIGVFQAQYRSQCVAMGEQLGLYKDEFVHKGCTPNYLPAFIAIEAGKRNL